jgi:DNA-binding PadR family transcriptional regulator
MYTTLDRLEAKGLVMSRLGDPTPQRGGRAKRLFVVTPGGVEAVARAQRAYQKLMEHLVLPEVSSAWN